MIARLKDMGKTLRRDKGPHGEPAANGLGKAHGIRLDGAVHISKPFARAADTSLNLIEEEKGIVLLAQGLDPFKIPRSWDMDAAFTLDRFDEDASYIIVHNGFDGRKVAERHIRKTLRQRRQSFMIVVLTGRGQRFHGAAVKRILCRNDAKFCRVLTAAIFAGIFPQIQRN